MTKRVVILISGSGSNMVSLVKDMSGDHPCKPVLVISNRPDAAGLEKAAAMRIDTAVVDHKNYGQDRKAFDTELARVIEAAEPDIICFAGFMRILGEDFTRQFEGKMLNIHPSLLPKYKGLNTHQRALDAGDEIAGCSVHAVTAELDGGPVLGQAVVRIEEDDTAETLGAKVLIQEHRLYRVVLRRFAMGETGFLSLV